MSLESYIQAMPKVELDIHLEGAMRKETLLTIAEQNDIPDNAKPYNELVKLMDNPDYQHLDELGQSLSQWLQHPDDLSRVVYELGVGLAKQNVQYAEVHVNPILYMENIGITFEQFLTGINDGRSRSERGWQVRMGWILDVPRDQPRKADDIIRWATSASARKNGIVGVGLSGREDAQPLGQFERPFKTAQKKGLMYVVQAGDQSGAEGILEAIQQLEPNRIESGWGTADAPDVIDLLLERQLPLNVSLGHGLCLGQVESYSRYPLRQIFDDGILLAIHSSKPTFYQMTLVDEYLALIEHNDFSLEELEVISRNAIRASWLPDEEKDAMLQTFAAQYIELREEHSPEAQTSSR